jgi:hypothetical protein
MDRSSTILMRDSRKGSATRRQMRRLVAECAGCQREVLEYFAKKAKICGAPVVITLP